MDYRCGFQDIESPRLRNAGYFSGDLDRSYLLDEYLGIEIGENPHELSEQLKGDYKNPTTTKSAQVESEDAPKSGKENILDYIPEQEYSDELWDMAEMPVYFSPIETVGIIYMFDRKPKARKPAQDEAELDEAA